MIFSSRRFLQKTNGRILLYYYETSGRLVFFRFLEEIEDTQKTFRNYPTFRILGQKSPTFSQMTKIRIFPQKYANKQ